MTMLFKLIEDIKIIRTNIKNDIEIAGMTKKSSECSEGYIFFAHKGLKTNGNYYIGEAVRNGARVVVTDQFPLQDMERDFPLGEFYYILTENSRKTEAELWMKWYGYPSENLKIIGVTGTNGKTSVSYMIKEILSSAGYKTALLGTIKYNTGDNVYDSDLTTSDPDRLAKLFYDIKKSGCEYVVMEVSSHSLKLEKVSALRFYMGIFTNLTQDHLDFHGNMEDYKNSKAKLFGMSGISLINADDPAADDMASASAGKNYFYSAESKDVEFKAENIFYNDVNGSEFDFSHEINTLHLSTPIPGKPYIYNCAAAAAAAELCGIEDEIIAKSLISLLIPGRIEKIPTGTDFSVFIDFAHTPDAIQNLLESVNKFKKGRVIILFGCGGDRDKGKRPLMGRIAAENSDLCIITSDNSRSENPEDIIADIESGLEGINKTYVKITDRKKAIEYALSIAEKDDIILLAGKGHENYIVDKDGKREFNEKQTVINFLAEMEN